MGCLREVELRSSFPPFAAFREYFGFIPNVFRAQSLAPRLIEAEAGVVASLFVTQKALSRIQKERILLAVAAANRDPYCVTLQYQNLYLLGVTEAQIEQIINDHSQASLSAADSALLDFALKLGAYGQSISQEDVARCFAHGWTDESVLETVLVTAWATFLCSIATGLGVVPDFGPIKIPTGVRALFLGRPNNDADSSGPYLRSVEYNAGFAAFSFFREQFGFVPNLFQAQTLRPDLIQAEADVFNTVVLTQNFLNWRQKECILLVNLAAARNTYWVAALCHMLNASGISTTESDQIAMDHRRADLSAADKALLDFALKLILQPWEFCCEDLESLRKDGFTEEQILEAVATSSFSNFLHVLQMGLAAKPDFPARPIFLPAPSKTVHFVTSDRRPTHENAPSDPDAETVARVQAGELDAFEDLIDRHSRRVYRTLVGVLGNPEEARDALQETFLKAFQHLGDFQRRSKFSTWLVSIATNTGLQVLRERKHHQTLEDDSFEPDEGFRPREIRAWSDDPEQLYSKVEIRALVESSIMKLPAKYRLVVLLRDIEQLPIEDAAAALGLSPSALKTRLLRGRLMLREALASHFTTMKEGVA